MAEVGTDVGGWRGGEREVGEHLSLKVRGLKETDWLSVGAVKTDDDRQVSQEELTILLQLGQAADRLVH